VHTLKLLHISDLHQKRSHDWRRERVLGEAWTRNLDDIKQRGGADLVCFTGDAAFSGSASEYKRAIGFFDATLDRLGLGRNRLFVVPGNHDIDQKVAESAWKRLRKELLGANRLDVSRWLAGGKPPFGFRDRDREGVLKRQEAYQEWSRSGLGRTSRSRGRLGYRRTVRLPGFPFDVHVLGLDSAWMCGDENDSGHLLLTDDQVMHLAADDSGNPLIGFRLGLIHHPLDEAADASDVRLLLAERVDLLLRGHLHASEPQVWSDPERTLRQVVAGCLYENDRYPNAFERISVELDKSGRPVSFKLWFRRWSPRGHWFDDNSLYPGMANGEVVLWQIAAAPDEAASDLRVARVFVGREPELQQLERSLLGRGEVLPVAICAVQGMPGVGKSYLAERFAYLHQDHFPGGVFRLVLDPEERAASTAESLLSVLAERLRLPPASAGIVERVRDRLLQPLSLLHVENVDDELHAEGVARLIGWLHGCPVLVTGRYQDLGESYGWSQIKVRPFSEATALVQLAQEVGEDSVRREEDAHRHLVQALGYLPLAVHLAAGHLRAGWTADGFLNRLRQTALALPPANAAERGLSREETRTILSRTFDLSLDLLRTELGGESECTLAGFFDLGHAPISGFGASLGAAISGLTGPAFERMAVAARGLSLVDLIPPSQSRDRSWRLHPLLAELLRARGAREGEARALARMTDWFCSRLPSLPAGQEDEQGRRWKEIHAETLALTFWLGRVPTGERIRVERAGSTFAIFNGPFHAWSSFCEEMLAQELDDRERSDALWTLGRVAFNSGALDRALSAAQEQANIDERRDAPRDAALAAGLVADVFQARGDLDEALRIRREVQLPVFERLSDVKACAVTMGQIADVLQERGNLDEALRIRTEQELPAYERLDDVRERAGAMSRIADVKELQGDLDEALRIRHEEVLPVYKRLGDVRSHALTMGKIANALETKGEFDEALRIRREEELPVYEPLGDMRMGALTVGKIADLLEARGELDEALHLRRDEQLPIYERLGAMRERAVTMAQIADLLRRRGDLEEALRIPLEEQFPFLERMGFRRELLRGRASRALIYLARNAVGDREAAVTLLHLALKSAYALRISLVEEIRAILDREGLPLEPQDVPLSS
jgi:tetratricopeptide (TPR) repeat protein/predicted phosphodiesterase